MRQEKFLLLSAVSLFHMVVAVGPAYHFWQYQSTIKDFLNEEKKYLSGNVIKGAEEE